MQIMLSFFFYPFLSNVCCFLFQYTLARYGAYEAEYHFVGMEGQELVLLKNRAIIHSEIVAVKNVPGR